MPLESSAIPSWGVTAFLRRLRAIQVHLQTNSAEKRYCIGNVPNCHLQASFRNLPCNRKAERKYSLYSIWDRKLFAHFSVLLVVIHPLRLCPKLLLQNGVFEFINVVCSRGCCEKRWSRYPWCCFISYKALIQVSPLTQIKTEECGLMRILSHTQYGSVRKE